MNDEGEETSIPGEEGINRGIVLLELRNSPQQQSPGQHPTKLGLAWADTSCLALASFDDDRLGTGVPRDCLCSI
jgi:hypothetical protein